MTKRRRLTSGANVFRRVYLCKRMIFWTFRPNTNVRLRFCDQKKIKWFLLKTLVWSRDSSKGLYFYITQLPIRLSFRLSLVLNRTFGLILKIRPNSGLILKIRPNACGHLKHLCKLGLWPKFGLRISLICFIKSHSVYVDNLGLYSDELLSV